MKNFLLGTLFGSGLLVGSPLLAQVLLPQYSLWEGFAFGDKQTVESRETEERLARFLLGMEQQTLPNEQSIQFADKYLKKWAFCPLLENSLHCDLSNYFVAKNHRKLHQFGNL